LPPAAQVSRRTSRTAAVQSTGRRFGTAVNDAGIIPVEY
jgi:hypothetical protein